MEEENRYQEALETAKEIDIVENVMIRTVTTQMAFSSMMRGLESRGLCDSRFSENVPLE